MTTSQKTRLAGSSTTYRDSLYILSSRAGGEKQLARRNWVGWAASPGAGVDSAWKCRSAVRVLVWITCLIPPRPTFPRCSAADVGNGHASAAGTLTITNGSLLASKMWQNDVWNLKLYNLSMSLILSCHIHYHCLVNKTFFNLLVC